MTSWEFEICCLTLDEGNDTSNTAQLLIIIQGITESSEVVGGLDSLKSLLGTTEAISFWVSETMKELDLL